MQQRHCDIFVLQKEKTSILDKAIIALPGPSLDFDNIDEEITVVCVNLALYWAPRCDFWVAMDRPKDIHYKCEAAYEETMPLIVTYGDGASWREFSKGKEILCVAVEPEWLMRAFGRPDNSMLLALCFLVQNGVTNIELRGCDQKGVGYKILESDLDIYKGEEVWEDERERLSKVITACKENEVTVWLSKTGISI